MVLSLSRIETRRFAGGEQPKIEAKLGFFKTARLSPTDYPSDFTFCLAARARGLSMAVEIAKLAAEGDGQLVVGINQSGAAQRQVFGSQASFSRVR